MAHTHTRSLGPPDPLNVPPRSDMEPNLNPAVGSVGPNVPQSGDPAAQQGASGGYGAQHVMYLADDPPLQAAAWAGWPSEWATPNTASLGGWGMSNGADLDIVWACADLNARVTGDMPAYVTRGPQLIDPPTWLTGSPQPEVYGTWTEFWKQVWWARQVVGEAFVVCTSRYADTGMPRTFMMVAPWAVSVDMVDGVRRYSVGGAELDDPRDMLHVRYMSWPGDAHGHGPLEVAGHRVTAARALMRYGADLAQNGGIPWAVLTHKYRLTKAQADNLKQQWIESARSRMGAPAIIDNDMTLQALNVTPRDMALSDQQKYAEARLAVLMGVPPELVSLSSDTGSLTYQNVSMLHDRHWRTGLKPGAREIFAELSAWALPRGVAVNLNAEAYIAPGPVERAGYFQTMVAIGAMTPAEVRVIERIPISDVPLLTPKDVASDAPA